jgi:undecaprenyl phosphate N,N'-diacetylbacillosamine 1-phosphate transferase
MYRLFFKRVLDFILSCLVLLITSPILLLVAVINYISLRESPFFFQDRPGKGEKKIRIIKFKSMNNKRDAAGKLLPDNQRITPFGKLLRKTSIDELPQLLNVITGDMSLIGPRPLLFRYIPLYNETQKRRHEVRPGITGWAQVNGRNAISWHEKFKLDVYYVDNASFLLDLKICWLTILKVLLREGVNQGSDRPMNPFTGNN